MVGALRRKRLIRLWRRQPWTSPSPCSDGDGVYRLLPAQAGGNGVRNLSQGLEALAAKWSGAVAGPALAQRSLSPETLALPGPLDAELAAVARPMVLTY